MSQQSDDTAETDDSDVRGRSIVKRRRMLAGLASVGLVGSLTGAGSRMVLSDTERFEENVLQVGRLDLRLAWDAHHEGERLAAVGDCGSDDPADYVDNQRPVVALDGIEPGDSGSLRVCLLLRGGPGVVWTRLRQTATPENGITQTEADAGDTTDDVGELQEHLEVTMWQDADCDRTPDEGERVLADGSLAEAVDQPVGDGVRLAEAETTPLCVGLSWHLPDTAPPTILTDAVEFTVDFAAEQSRRNENPSNPWTTP